MSPREPTWRIDFAWLWRGYTISEMGSAVGAGALPLVAVLVLHSSTAQVSLLAALSGLAGAALTLPLGPRLEFRPKRPVMIAADVMRFVVLASVPVATVLGVLSFAQLCAVGVLQTVATVCFNAASGAHVKALLPESHRVRAASRFETTYWTAATAGPPLGGVLIS